MGRQITTYLSRQDSQDFESHLLRIEPSILLRSRSRGPFPQPYDQVEGASRDLFLYLVRLDDLDKVVTKEVPTQGYWTIIDLYSPVIEVTRSGDIDGLRPGRLYYIESYFNQTDKLTAKSDEFRNWAKRVLSKARRLLTYDKQLGAYLGREAVEMREKGVYLGQGFRPKPGV